MFIKEAVEPAFSKVRDLSGWMPGDIDGYLFRAFAKTDVAGRTRMLRLDTFEKALQKLRSRGLDQSVADQIYEEQGREVAKAFFGN